MGETLARDDWDRHWTRMGEAATSNPAQAMRRRITRALLDATGPDVRILDIGCGQGDLMAELRRHLPEAELYGIDHSRRGVDIARARVPDARFAQWDLLRCGEPEAALAGWATHAVCSEVLEHVDDPEALLTNARACLAAGCRVVVTVPGGPISAFDRHIGHRRHYTRESLRRTLVAAGLRVEHVSGAGFPFFNLYRGVVIIRGGRMVRDVGGDGSALPSPPARAAMAAFRVLLSIPVPTNRLGWQLVGVATEPRAV
jgi:2-polyprenyl-3-methyl-5-hydroxy-6-metoxy-1,4-benzoquinol methylase